MKSVKNLIVVTTLAGAAVLPLSAHAWGGWDPWGGPGYGWGDGSGWGDFNMSFSGHGSGNAYGYGYPHYGYGNPYYGNPWGYYGTPYGYPGYHGYAPYRPAPRMQGSEGQKEGNKQG